MSEKPKYYITTAIAYTSGKPHIGNTYEIVLADAIARYKRSQGYDVFFQTGTDEHGQKIELKAEEAGITPKEFVDNVSTEIKRIWDLMDTSYDKFIRTTDEDHEKQVKKIFKKLYDKGDIYKGHYEGMYCTPCESFFTESQLVDGKCPDCGRPVQPAKEEAYFFKMSKYADRLIEHINTHPEFIQPVARKNEMMNNFLLPGLQDLCVSRTSFKWGIPVDFDPKHVVYVWLDALTNYITGIGYDADGNSTEQFNKLWPADLHLIGKDIIRFHTIYWPIFLMALGLPLPKQVFGHPWLLQGDGKMSKSKGNVIYPETLVDRYGLDATRYYLLKAMPFGNDGVFSPEDFVDKVNFDLANDLGNLLNRTVAMINKYQDGVLKGENAAATDYDQDLEATAAQAFDEYKDLMDKTHFADALSAIWKLISRANKYIDETTPWLLAKDETKKEELSDVMTHLAKSLRMVAAMLQPIMTHAPKEILDQLGLPKEDIALTDLSFDDFPAEVKVAAKGTPIFPRRDVEEEVAFIKSQMSANQKAKGRKAMAEAAEKAKTQAQLPEMKKDIRIDVFDKVDLRVAQIKAADHVEGADKLLKFQLDDGTAEGRQILSGIAQWYPDPSVLVGKKVLIVANLKPRKMRGELSQGMILSDEDAAGNVQVVTVPENMQPGTTVC